MPELGIRDLGLTAKGDGCACCAAGAYAHGTAATTESALAGTVVTDYLVEGMTCSHCAQSVTEGLGALDGVRSVAVDLQVGGTSRVTVASAAPLDADAVADAVDVAGYRLVTGS